MKYGLSILLAGPSLLALTTTAFAQPAAPARVEDAATQTQEINQAGEEEGAIVVTARRRAESLLDVPQTVQAVTGQQLQEYNILKFEDISDLVPGLQLSAPTNGIGLAASTRGATFSGNAQGSATVESYINEHPVDITLMFQNQFDVGQIEVLKGPQGTMRGRSSPSGAMTLTTRRPDLNEAGGFVSMTGTSRHGINVQAGFGLPIIEDVLAIRIAGLVDHNDDNGVESATTHQGPDFRTHAIRGTVRFEPTDNLSAVVMYQRLRRNSATFGGRLYGTGAAGVDTPAQAGGLTDNLAIANTTASPFQSCVPTPGTMCAVLNGGTARITAPAGFNGPVIDSDEYLSVQDFPTLGHQESDVLTGQFDWRFAGQRLSYVGGLSKFVLDATGGGGDASNTIVGVQAAPLGVGNVADTKHFTNELRLSSDERLFDIFDYTIGAYRGKVTGNTSSPTFAMLQGAFGSPLGCGAGATATSTTCVPANVLPGGTGLLTPFTFNEKYGIISDRVSFRKNVEKAVFANLIARLFDDKLELEAGGRQIWYSATKSQATTFLGGRLQAVRNPNGTAPCPGTLTGVSSGGVTFVDAAVQGTTYPGTCDVLLTLNNGIRAPSTDQPLGTRKWSPFVYRLSASYKFSPDHMAYISYGTAWRAGPGPITGAPNCAAANDATPNDASHPNPLLCDPFNFLNPDKSKAVEVGFKGAFFDRKLSFTVAAFKQEYDNFFVFGSGFALQGTCIYPHIVNVTQQPGGCTASTAIVTFNAPVKTKGIDFDFNFRPSDHLSFGGAASWADSKYGAATIPCSDRNFDGVPDGAAPTGFTATQFLNGWPGGGQAGDQAFGVQLCDTSTVPALKPSDAPKWNFNVRGEFSHDVFTDGEIFIRALFNYTPKNKNLNPVTTFIPKAYGILNMYAGLRGTDGAWEISFAARNLLNNKTLLSDGTGINRTMQALTRPVGASGQSTLSFTGPIAPDGTASANSSGYRTISNVARREFQLSVRFAFGSR